MEYEVIKNRWTGEVMCGGLSLKVVIENHKKWLWGQEGGSRANLRDADLSAADLRAANLRDANLRAADLSAANLRDANLRDADLRAADLSAANLRDANLSDADLRDANLSDAPFKIENIHQRVYEAAGKPGALDMSLWHNSCGTAHCRAGWVVTLAGEAGRVLEWMMGTPAAAALIYIASDNNIGKMPDFYASNDDALEDMRIRAEQEAARKTA